MMFCRWQSATSPLDPSEFCTLDHIKQYNNGVSLSWRQIQLALLNTFTVSPVFIIRFETNHEMHHRFDSKSRCSRKHWGENNVKLQCRWQPPLRPISEQIWTHFSTLHHRSRAFDVSWFCVNVPVDVIVRSDMRCVFDLQLLTAGAGMCVCVCGGGVVAQRDRSGDSNTRLLMQSTSFWWRSVWYSVSPSSSVQPALIPSLRLSLAGKSYTMIGRDDSLQTLGIIPCAISWLFKLINERKEKTGARFSVRVSAVEVSVTDLILKCSLQSWTGAITDKWGRKLLRSSGGSCSTHSVVSASPGGCESLKFGFVRP